MRIYFDNKFYESDYADNPASMPGRMESIIDEIQSRTSYSIICPKPATEEELCYVHSLEYIESIKQNEVLYNMALLSAGGAIAAMESAMNNETAFACIRPPGHHAYRESAWGYCYFSNMAIALTKLRMTGRIRSAFILDFDAHTGDGTIDCLSDWKECIILNPYTESNKDYINIIENFISGIGTVDIVAVCAGFDSYVKDAGKKLETEDFFTIGYMMKNYARKCGHNRRFATLEGGYYLPDLGKNVVAFCNGFG